MLCIFQCWRAASFLKHRLDHKECLALAKKYLNYTCNEEQADSVYSKLRMLKKKFSQAVALRNEEEQNSFENQLSASRLADGARQMHGGTSESASSHPESGEIKVALERQRPSGRQLDSEFEEASVHLLPLEIQQNLGTMKDALLGKRIDLINMICSKRNDALLLQQQMELSDFNVYREEEKMRLKSKHDDQLELIRSIHTDCTVRNDKIRMLNQEFSKKMAEFDQHMKCQRRKLADMQEDAKNKEQELRSRWAEEAKAGTLAESFDTLPLTESGFSLEEFTETTRQVEACDSSRSILSVSIPSSDPLCLEVGVTENLTKIPSPFPNGMVELEQPLVSHPDHMAEAPIGASADIIETVFPNMIDVESTEPNETTAEILGPVVNMMCNDVITTVHGMSNGIAGNMPSTFSVPLMDDVHGLASKSGDVAEAEPILPNRACTDVPEVPDNMAGPESVGPDESSVDISESIPTAAIGDRSKDIRIPFSDAEVMNDNVNEANVMHMVPTGRNGVTSEVPETTPPKVVEPEYNEANETPAKESILLAEDVDMSKDSATPDSELNVPNALGNQPENTDLVPSLTSSLLHRGTESAVFQSPDIVDVEHVESNRMSCGFSPNILSSEGYVEDLHSQMNMAGDGPDKICMDPKSARTAEDTDVHHGQDVDNPAATCLRSSPLQNSVGSLEMNMAGNGPHENNAVVATNGAVIDRLTSEAENNSDSTCLRSSPLQILVDFPSASHAPTDSCCEKSTTCNLVRSSCMFFWALVIYCSVVPL